MLTASRSRTWRLLLVEVAESSLASDQGLKLELYAGAGIAEYWIVHVEQHILVAHRDPADGRYRTVVTIAGRDQTLAPLAFPDLVLSLGDFSCV
jgi:Uma2 family endonuclease